jgi:glycosyltransferase involved in cell wall biosynthesis
MNAAVRSPTISVIVPHLNQPAELRRCLASLHAQDFDLAEVEIIVVDNGSTDLPVEVCNAFAGVRLYRETEPGPGPARNLGVRASQAGILAFIDADCIADRNWLAAVHQAFSDDAVEVIGGDVRIARVDPARATMLEAYESVYAYRQREYIAKQGFSGTGNLAVRRSTYDAVGPFAGIHTAEDRDWGQRATRLGRRVHYVPGMIVLHPARRTIADLFAKWDRHISHDFEQREPGLASWSKWALRAVAIGVSPIYEMQRIVRSDRVSSWRERRLAAIAMARIRYYRASRMLQLLMGRLDRPWSHSWNRP